MGFYGAWEMHQPDLAGEDAQLEALAEVIVGPRSEPWPTGEQIDLMASIMRDVRRLLAITDRRDGEPHD